MQKNLELHLEFATSSFRIYLDDLSDLTSYQLLQSNIYYFLKQVFKTHLKSNQLLKLIYVILRSQYQSLDIMWRSYRDEYVLVDDCQEQHELVFQSLIIFVFQALFLSISHQEFSQFHHQLNLLTQGFNHFILLIISYLFNLL